MVLCREDSGYSLTIWSLEQVLNESREIRGRRCMDYGDAAV